MDIVNTKTLNCNSKFKINFNGGDLSSDAGLILLKEFCHKLKIEQLIETTFKTNDTACRYHTDGQNLLQVLYQIFAGYFKDNHADYLTNDPVMTRMLEKNSLASQPTLSRFFNRMDETTLKQLADISKIIRKQVYAVKQPEIILLDLDSTLLETYGKQEGNSFNFHYKSNGYHPLLCFDGLTGDLLKIELRNGSTYSSTDVEEFMQPLLDEFLNDYPETNLFLRGDSGFTKPELYEQCESNGVSYAIRLKANNKLRAYAAHLCDELTEITAKNSVDYAVVYGEFLYQASSWEYPRRVVCKVEKPTNQFVHMLTFVVTNMDSSPQDVIKFYCKRGTMENYIKECKNGFDFASVSSSSKIVNSNRLQIHALAYNIFNYFKRLVLPVHMRKQQINTIRLTLIKIAAKVVKASRYITFKLCSSCPYIKEFYDTLKNIEMLEIQLE